MYVAGNAPLNDINFDMWFATFSWRSCSAKSTSMAQALREISCKAEAIKKALSVGERCALMGRPTLYGRA